jgi:predicted Zn-dependent peptidase
MFKKTTLANGLRIITVPQKGTQAVTCLVLVGTGSKYENKKISGISHLLEHLLFKGTEKRPTHLEIAEPLDRVGGIYNAFTGEDYTGYFAKVDAKHFDLALDVISDIYLNSKLDSEEIKKEKGVVIEEINMYRDHPTSHVQELWSKLLYGDQPAGWNIAGTKESVVGIERKELLNYMKTQYSASNTIICVAGGMPKTNGTIAKIENYFSKIENKEVLKKPSVLEKQENPQCLIENRKTDQTHLCLGVRGYNMFHPQKYAFELLGLILGGMMSSRLFASVRERLGLAYYIRTNASSDPDSGFLMTQAGVDNLRVEKAISAILEEYKKISENKVSEDELNKVKDHIKGKMVLLFEASDELASFYGAQDLLEKKILTSEEIYKEIDKVTVDDILKVSRDIFQPDKLNLSLIGPFKNKKQFYKILKL